LLAQPLPDLRQRPRTPGGIERPHQGDHLAGGPLVLGQIIEAGD